MPSAAQNDGVAELFEKAGEALADVRLVVDQQDVQGCSSIGRDDDRKGGAAVFIVARLDAAAKLADDGLTDAEAQAQFPCRLPWS